MKIEWKDFCEHIEYILERNSINIKFNKETIQYLYEKYNIPIGLSSDIICRRVDAKDQRIEVLYHILKCYEEKAYEKYFTDVEIRTFEKYKYKDVKPKLNFNMIQIDTSQWVGKIKVKDLMNLRDARLITYNENTQRPLTRTTSNGVEWYKISINRNQVESIIESFKNETYIPNTITLNMPETTVFHYNEEEHMLQIKDIENFDIIDGYHRYVSMSNIYNINNNFDYTMELRIVQFTESRAQQFIWQEDQKTKMTQLSSESFNQNNYSNQIVNYLNSDTMFRGLINRNDAIIDASYLAMVVNIIYFNENKKYELADIIKIKKDIGNKLEYIAEESVMNDNALLTKRWKRRFILSFVFLCKKDVPKNILLEEIQKLTQAIYNAEKNDDVIIQKNIVSLTKRNITRLDKLYNTL